MADARIQDLSAVFRIQGNDHLVIEHNNTAYKLEGQVLLNWLTAAADGHGGFRDTFTKVDENGLVDIYEATLADGTKNQITVTNGDSGVHIGKEPVPRTANVWLDTTDYKNPVLRVRYSQDGPWQAIESTTGEPARLIERRTEYQYDPQGVNIPTNPWLPEPPPPLQGMYLWTRVTDVWNKEKKSAVTYTVSYQGQDGVGTVNSVNGKTPDSANNVTLILKDIKGDSTHRTVTDQEKKTWNGGVTTAGNALPKAGGTMSGNLDMNQNKVLNLPEPVNDGDAANKGYVDKLGLHLLWENSDDTQPFGAQNITVDGLSGYKYVAIDAAWSKDAEYSGSTRQGLYIFPMVPNYDMSITMLKTDPAYITQRLFTMSGDLVRFEAAYGFNLGSKDTDPNTPNRVIPLAIYGIK